MISWPDLKLPPINLWSSPRMYISLGGVVERSSRELIRSDRFKGQVKELNKYFNRARKDK